MYINSPGGIVTAGLAIYDTMQYISSPVATLCVGQAASMGSLLLAAGEKGHRRALPHSRIMLHQPSGGYQGQATDIRIHTEEILRLRGELVSSSSLFSFFFFLFVISKERRNKISSLSTSTFFFLFRHHQPDLLQAHGQEGGRHRRDAGEGHFLGSGAGARLWDPGRGDREEGRGGRGGVLKRL